MTSEVDSVTIDVVNRWRKSYLAAVGVLEGEEIVTEESADTRLKILCVEDEAGMLDLLRLILESAGYAFVGAKDGQEGLEAMRRERPDLVLLDLMMPEVDGFQVLETIKADEDLADTRIIVITAKTLSAGERRRLSGQIELLLQKGSFMDDELLEEILATLNEK